MSRKIATCLSPALVPHYDLDNTIVVVIDIFRATSAICYGIGNGASAFIPVKTVEECLSYSNNNYLLAAERNGSIIEGFELGNSPLSYTKDKVYNKTIVITTTNGTQAIHAAHNASKIVIGSFLNLGILSQWLKKQPENVLLLCSGWKNQFNLEDTLFAGAVIEQIASSCTHICDASIAARILYLHAQENLIEFAKKTSHNTRLQELNLEQDIQLCLQKDLINCIPILVEDKIIKMAQ